MRIKHRSTKIGVRLGINRRRRKCRKIQLEQKEKEMK
jgi:hypothetical protein